MPESSTRPPDRELLERWRDGDGAAGAALYDRHAASVARFFRNKVGPECDDLVQQTFEACLRSHQPVAASADLRVFLLGIARHKLYDHVFRRRGNMFKIDPLTVSIADVDPTPSSIAARHERDRQLAWSLRCIPLQLQALLELHYWEGLSTAELADVLGIPQGTVKSRMTRARALLREQLEAAPGVGSELDMGAGLDTWARSLRATIDDESS